MTESEEVLDNAKTAFLNGDIDLEDLENIRGEVFASDVEDELVSM